MVDTGELEPTVDTAEVDELSVGEVIAPPIASVDEVEDDELTAAPDAWLVFRSFGIVYFELDDLKRPVPPGLIMASSSAWEEVVDEEVDEEVEEDDDEEDWPGASFVLAKLIFSPEFDCVLMVNWESTFRLYRPPFSEADLGTPLAPIKFVGPESLVEVEVVVVEEELLSARALGADDAELISDDEAEETLVNWGAAEEAEMTGEEGTSTGTAEPSLPMLFWRSRSTTALIEFFFGTAFPWPCLPAPATLREVDAVLTTAEATEDDVEDCWRMGWEVMEVWICFGVLKDADEEMGKLVIIPDETVIGVSVDKKKKHKLNVYNKKWKVQGQEKSKIKGMRKWEWSLLWVDSK